MYIYIFVYVWSPPPAPPKLRIRPLTIYKLRTRSLTIYKYIRNNNKSLSLHLQNSCLPHFLERPHLTLPATSGVETENHFTRRLQHMCAKKNVVQWIGVCCVLYTYIYTYVYVFMYIIYIRYSYIHTHALHGDLNVCSRIIVRRLLSPEAQPFANKALERTATHAS